MTFLLLFLLFFSAPWTAEHQASLFSPSPRICPIHIHCIGDAIQPSHPLLPSSPAAFNLSHQQGVFQRVSSLDQGGQSIGASASASVLPKSIQG